MFLILLLVCFLCFFAVFMFIISYVIRIMLFVTIRNVFAQGLLTPGAPCADLFLKRYVLGVLVTKAVGDFH